MTHPLDYAIQAMEDQMSRGFWLVPGSSGQDAADRLSARLGSLKAALIVLKVARGEG